MGVVLAGRVAAILGILMRTQTGWWLAVAVFTLIIALNVAAAMSTEMGPVVVVRVGVPAGCLVYLILLRSEFG